MFRLGEGISPSWTRLSRIDITFVIRQWPVLFAQGWGLLGRRDASGSFWRWGEVVAVNNF